MVLKSGVIQQVDSPSELYKHPANMFVAGFIGSPAMNFFHGTVEKDGENAVINFAGNKIRLTPDRARMVLDAGYLGKKVVMGVRPEHIHAAEEVGDNAKCQKFTADIETVENLGADNLIYFNIENSFYCAKAGEDFAQKSGKVALALELERIHLFDPETQLTITNKKGV